MEPLHENDGNLIMNEPPPLPRIIRLYRHPEFGFGFVAGSQKPVIVRFVKEGGPSEKKLEAGDEILKINDEDVYQAPRERVIQLVKCCTDSVLLTVCQPRTNTNSIRKSALLTAAKKVKLKMNPNRVRFAEGIGLNENQISENHSNDSCLPFLPNVLKVFLENGQTKTFKYDSLTVVQNVLNSLREKLSIKQLEHYALCLDQIRPFKRNKLTILDPNESLDKIAARPGAQNLRCYFRVTFVPKDATELWESDPETFEYLYNQCCNDVVQERFSPDLKYEIALQLSALQLHQYSLSKGMLSFSGKVNLKHLEREVGLEPFVPFSLMENMKRKELHKLLNHFLKQNSSQLSSTKNKIMTSIEAKCHYLRILGELPSYGARMFQSYIRDSGIKSTILVGPKFGISYLATTIKHSIPISLARIEDVVGICVKRKEEEVLFNRSIQIKLTSPSHTWLYFTLGNNDTNEFLLLLQGYHRVLSGKGSEKYKPLSISFQDFFPFEGNEIGNLIGNLEIESDEIGERLAEDMVKTRISDNNEFGRAIDNDEDWDSNQDEEEEELRAINGMPEISDIISREMEELRENEEKDDALRRMAQMNEIIREAEEFLVKKDLQEEFKEKDLIQSNYTSTESPTIDYISGSDDCSKSTSTIRESDVEDEEKEEGDDERIFNDINPGVIELDVSDDMSSFSLQSPDITQKSGNNELDSVQSSSIPKINGISNESPIHINSNIIDLTALPPPSTPDFEEDSDTIDEKSSHCGSSIQDGQFSKDPNCSDELNSLILPPPPMSCLEEKQVQDEVISKFWKATDDVKKIYLSNKAHLSPPLSCKTDHETCNSSDSGHDSVPSYLISNNYSKIVDTNDNKYNKGEIYINHERISESSSWEDLYHGKGNGVDPSKLVRSQSWTSIDILEKMITEQLKYDYFKPAKPPVPPKPALPPKPTIPSKTVLSNKKSKLSNGKQNNQKKVPIGSVKEEKMYKEELREEKKAEMEKNITKLKADEMFIQAQRDIDLMLLHIEEVQESRLNNQVHSLLTYNPDQFELLRQDLIDETRHFVTASRHFVKSSTELFPELLDYLLDSIYLLNRMFTIGQSLLLHIHSESTIHCLVDRLKEVAATFAYTVDTVHKLTEFVSDAQEVASSPYMGLLMNHATSLANSLATLLRNLREVDS